MSAWPVRVANPEREAEYIGNRSRQARATRKANDRIVCARLREDAAQRASTVVWRHHERCGEAGAVRMYDAPGPDPGQGVESAGGHRVDQLHVRRLPASARRNIHDAA